MPRVKLVILLITVMIASGALADERTLFSGQLDKGSGYGAVFVQNFPVKTDNGMVLGAECIWLANKAFFFGGTVAALVSSIDPADFNPNDSGKLFLSYGGAKLGVIVNSDSIIHLVPSVLIGFGTLAYNQANGNVTDQSTVSIIEPALDLELNMVANFRLDLGMKYHLVGGVANTSGLGNADLSGLSLALTAKLGLF